MRCGERFGLWPRNAVDVAIKKQPQRGGLLGLQGWGTFDDVTPRERDV
jgi:hypothetical protein